MSLPRHFSALVSYVAKGLLPYHGLGSGIKRALADWPEIDFAENTSYTYPHILQDTALRHAFYEPKPGSSKCPSSLSLIPCGGSMTRSPLRVRK